MVINFAYSFWFILKMVAYWVDMRYCRALRYWQTTPLGTIITNFLAGLVVFILVVYSPVMLAIGIAIW